MNILKTFVHIRETCHLSSVQKRNPKHTYIYRAGKLKMSPVWWHTPVTPSVGRLMEEISVNLRLVWASC